MAQPLSILDQQQAFFKTGHTRRLKVRQTALRRLKKAIRRHEDAILEALAQDFSKPRTETYLSELYPLYDEIDYALRHLPRWIQGDKVATPISHIIAKSQIRYEPYGSVCILSPWNYPVALALTPLVGALAAGNTVILRSSAKVPATRQVMTALLEEAFPSYYVAMVDWDYETIHAAIAQGVDYVFFTGGKEAGRKVAQTCADHLVPYSLELGGKSPAIVLADASLKRTAQRLVWGKYLNAGQTCIAPDYVLVDRRVKDALVEALEKELQTFYGQDPISNPDFASLIDDSAWQRLVDALEGQRILYGGQSQAGTRRLAPTLVDEPSLDSILMTEEIFGPILPIVSFTDLDALLGDLHDKPSPLALYLFTESEEAKAKVFGRLSFGGGCVNDTLIHYANPNLPFGGVGDSGIGAYHGRFSFETFSYPKSICERSTCVEYPFRHAPYRYGPWLRKALGLFGK